MPLVSEEVKETSSAIDRTLDRLRANVKRHHRSWLRAAVVVQVVALIVLAIPPWLARYSGDAILLRVKPIDPRDLLRGDYVMLQYEFSTTWHVQGLDPYQTFPLGKPVYVPLTLEPDGKHWHGMYVTTSKPVSGKYLRGHMDTRWRCEFGIETFFVQEGKGRAYEEASRTGHLSAEISLQPNGRAMLKSLHIE
ncbi:MAG: hypothetical protein RIS70_454 [Planctomycetota bacterium]|jgi:uncharacterized membrane-anchored protein